MLNYFLGAALAVAPFFIKEGSRVSASLSQEFFFATITALFVLFFGVKSHRNIKVMGALIFSAAFVSQDTFGLFPMYQLGMSIAGASFVAFVYGNRYRINHKLIFNILGAVCAIESIWVIAQSYGFNPHEFWMSLISDGYKVVNRSSFLTFGSLGNPNHSGALIACLLPFARWYVMPIAFIALYLGGSAMPVISSIVALVAFYSYSKREYLPIKLGALGLVLAAIALVLGVFNGTCLSDSYRIQAWSKFLNEFGIRFIGKGFGWVPSTFSREMIASQRFYQLHNEWLEVYSIAGLLGVVVTLFLILPVFKNRGNPAVNACLIALLVNSLGNFTFHISALFMVFAYCYALQLGDKEQDI